MFHLWRNRGGVLIEGSIACVRAALMRGICIANPSLGGVSSSSSYCCCCCETIATEPNNIIAQPGVGERERTTKTTHHIIQHARTHNPLLLPHQQNTPTLPPIPPHTHSHHHAHTQEKLFKRSNSHAATAALILIITTPRCFPRATAVLIRPLSDIRS